MVWEIGVAVDESYGYVGRSTVPVIGQSFHCAPLEKSKVDSDVVEEKFASLDVDLCKWDRAGKWNGLTIAEEVTSMFTKLSRTTITISPSLSNNCKKKAAERR